MCYNSPTMPERKTLTTSFVGIPSEGTRKRKDHRLLSAVAGMLMRDQRKTGPCSGSGLGPSALYKFGAAKVGRKYQRREQIKGSKEGHKENVYIWMNKREEK